MIHNMDVKLIEFDPFKHCRVCLQAYSEMCQIFGEGNGFENKLRECGRVEVEENDGLPVVMCEYCVQEMTQAHHFLTKCQDADRRLRMSISPDIKEGVMAVDNKNVSKLLDTIKVDPDEITFAVSKSDTFEDDNVSSSSKDNNSHTSLKAVSIRKKKMSLRSTSVVFPMKCSLCSIILRCKSAMIIHTRTHTNERPYQCSDCGECFRTKGVLKVHMAVHRDKLKDYMLNFHCKFQCDYCKKIFPRKSNLVTHIRVHTGDTPYSCKYCSRTFSQTSNLNNHIRLHTGERPYICSVCHKSYRTCNALNKHSIVHSNERKFSCAVCGLAFKTKPCLKSHIAVIHEKSKTVVCDQCGMSFNSPGNLRGHLRNVHSKYSGHCDVCNKDYSNIKEHNRQHTGETPYKCNYCEKMFSAKNRLNSHLRKHVNLDKFACEYEKCTKTFSMKSMLIFHILKYHKKHTPYICKHCNRGFYRLSDLKRHLKLNHSDEATILEDIKNAESC